MVTNKEYWDFVTEVAQRLIEAADAHADRWAQLVPRLGDFPPPQRRLAIETLASLAASAGLDKCGRQGLWTTVDTEVRRHRAFADAPWALAPDDVDQLAEIAEALTPSDLILASRWLFDESLPDVGSVRLDYAARRATVDVARTEALADVLNQGGIDALLELAKAVKYPGIVGFSLASLASADLDERTISLLDDENTNLVAFATGYTFARVQAEGWPWISAQLEKLSGRPAAQARVLLQSRDLQHAWKQAVDLGSDVDTTYWREFSLLGHGHDFPLVDEVAQSLMMHDRPLAAIDLLAMYADPDRNLVSAQTALQSLETLVRLPANHKENVRITDYELERLMDYARAASEVDEDRLARLEWALLPGLGFRARSPLLHRLLARDPSFFVQIVSLAYKPESGVAGEGMSSELATNAYRLLSEWRVIPGSNEKGDEIDQAELVDWVTTTQALLTSADRRDVGEIHIGQVLSHSPSDSDSTWPTLPVRNLIERVGSTAIETGLATQTRNNRGMTSRGALAGGEQERQLAKHYQELASRIRDEWPRTARVLTSIAQSYESEAHWHDEDAERLRQGMSG